MNRIPRRTTASNEVTNKIITIERHILNEQREFPDATGTLSGLLYNIGLAGKLIASRTIRGRRASRFGYNAELCSQFECSTSC